MTQLELKMPPPMAYTDLIPRLVGSTVLWEPAPPGWIGLRLNESSGPSRPHDQIEHLCQRQADVRYLVLKPCFDYFHLHRWLGLKHIPVQWERAEDGFYSVCTAPTRWEKLPDRKPLIDWVVLGFDDVDERRAYGRPMSPDVPGWHARQLQAAGVPFFFEGWGDWVPDSTARPDIHHDTARWAMGDGSSTWGTAETMRGYAGGIVRRPRDGENTRLLDGREWNEMPQPRRKASS